MKRSTACHRRVCLQKITTWPGYEISGKRKVPPNSPSSSGFMGWSGDGRGRFPQRHFNAWIHQGRKNHRAVSSQLYLEYWGVFFLSAGVHCVLADGVVRFLSQLIEIATMTSLITARDTSGFTCRRISKDPLVGRLDQNVFLRSVETVLILSPRGYQQHATSFHR